MSAFLIAIFLAHQDPLPVPDAAAQKEAENLIREVFGEDYAKPDKLALSQKLHRQALDTKDDMTARFVLLREARDLAAQAGNASRAFLAIDEMAKSHRIDAAAMKSAVLATASKSAKTAGELRSMAVLYLSVAAVAAAEEDYEIAIEAANSATGFAKRAKDAALATRAQTRAKELSEHQVIFVRARSASETLRTSPEDAAAHLAAGWYRCAIRQQWEEGLLHLAKGSDESLRQLAERDLSNSNSAEDQAAVADAWWDRGEKEAGLARDALRRRAVMWYERALSRLTGLAKAKAEKRIQDSGVGPLTGTWVDFSDSALFGFRSGEPIEMLGTSKGNRADMLRFPSGSFDAISARVRCEDNKSHGMIVYDNYTRCAVIDFEKNRVVLAHLADGRWVHDADAACEDRVEYELTIVLAGGDCIGYLDGREFGRMKTPGSRFTSLTLQASYGTVRFPRVRFRKQE